MTALLGSSSTLLGQPLHAPSDWTAINFGSTTEIGGDSQSGSGDTDIVGDASHGSFYTAFDDQGTVAVSDDSLLFRMRIGNPKNAPDFAGLGIVGIDANQDGRIDIYVAIDGGKKSRSIQILDPGTEANSSPKTTTLSALPSKWLPNGGVYAFTAQNCLIAAVSKTNDPHWNGSTDLDKDGTPDIFVTWRTPLADLASVLAQPSPEKKGIYGPRGSKGLAGFTEKTLVRYINFTQTQLNSSNGDLNGVGEKFDDKETFAALKVFTASMSPAAPAGNAELFSITQPLATDGVINATEDNALKVKGTAKANRWIRLTVTDNEAATNDIVTWTQADASDAWTTSSLDLNSLAEGTLTFTALVFDKVSDTLMPEIASASATAIHDKGLSLVQPAVNPLTAYANMPALTGTWGGSNSGANALTVTLNGVTYSEGGALLIQGKEWTLTVPAANGLSTGVFDVTATVTSNVGNVAIDATSGELTITAPPAGNGETPQTIAFSPPSKVSSHTPLPLIATASSGLPVTLHVVSGPAKLDGNVLSFTAAGSVTVTAIQEGDVTFLAAPEKTAVIESVETYIPSNVADGWTVTYGGEDDLLLRRNSDAKAIAMQVVGTEAVSVAATGSTTNANGDRDIFTAKYDAASGEKLWSVLHAGEAQGIDEGAAVAMDDLGHVWITGTVTNSAKNSDIYLAKYASADGALLWEHTFRGLDGQTDAGNDGAGGYQNATPYQGGDIRRNSIALCPDGSVVITGYVTTTDKKIDAITLKYDSKGNLAWSTSFNGPSNGTDYGHAVAVDSNGDVFITGGSINASLDAIVAKYEGYSGKQLWAQRYDGGKPDSAVAIKIDSEGNPVISGYSQRATFDFLTARYNGTDGTLLWMDLRDGPTKSSDMAWDFVLAEGTQPIITGTSYPYNGVFDGYTFRLAAPGSTAPVSWAARYEGPAAKQDQFVSIGADMFGNPIATGFSQNANGSYDTQTVKYAVTDGSILWQKRFNGRANGNDLPRQILVDPTGNVFIAGFTTCESGTTDSWVTRYVATLPANSADQAITFLQPARQGVADTLTLAATASSGLPVEYEIIDGPAIINEGLVTFTAMGKVTIRACQPGDDFHKPAMPVDRTFLVDQSRQVIALKLPPTTTAAAKFKLDVIASSGLPVTCTVIDGPGYLTEGMLAFKGAGAVTICASQSGDKNYQAAACVTRTINVTKAAQSISFNLPSTTSVTSNLTLDATTSSGLPVTYEIVSGPAAFDSGGLLAFNTTGRVTVRASQKGDDSYTPASSIQKVLTVTLGKPVLDPFNFKSNSVSETVAYRVSATRNPSRFTASGLPAGVTLNATTGIISGRPTAAKLKNGIAEPYIVTLAATNTAGSSESITIPWYILPLEQGLVGTFNGLVEPTETLLQDNAVPFTGLGGSVSLTTTATGTFSGKLVIDTLSYAFSGKLSTTTGSAVIKRASAPSLTVDFTLDPSNSTLNGSITDGVTKAPVAFTACRNVWSAALNPATALQGNYNAALEIPAKLQGLSQYPQGNGFGTIKITTAGVATWSGKLADGTAITASTTVGPKGQIALHIPLYSPAVVATAGALSGWTQILAHSSNPVVGSLRWKKNAQPAVSTTRNYKDGFPAHELTVIGDKYLGATLSSEAANPHKAILTFSEAGIESDAVAQASDGRIMQSLSLTKGVTAVLPATKAANPASIKLTINAATGLISGTFTLQDIQAKAIVTRTVTYCGVMIPRLNQGVGHFILPQLPDIKTSPQLSGQALLEVR